MKDRLDRLEDKTEAINLHVASISEKTDSAHKRIDEAGEEIKGLRDAKHDIYSKLHTHAGILVGIEGAVKDLIKSTKENTQAVLTFRVVAMTAIFMGSGFIAFIGFVGGKLLHWW